jgi:hypothetical protein
MTQPIDGFAIGLSSLQRLQAQQSFGGRVVGNRPVQPSQDEYQPIEPVKFPSFRQPEIEEFDSYQPAEVEEFDNSFGYQPVESYPPVRPTEGPRAARSTSGLTPELPIAMNEVRAIAEQAGFVGITDRDIRRAYVMGESLLADYRA